MSNQDNLLIGCPGNETKGMIFEIDPAAFTKIDSFKIPGYGFGKGISVDKKSSNIYFKSYTNTIVELNLDTEEVAEAVSDPDLIFVYGYGYDHTTGTHYVLDARNFSSNGSMIVYDGEGSKINSYETGIAPRRVVFEYSDTPTGMNAEVRPSNFKLHQNYPNPFNPVTNISFSIPEQSRVKLTVFNAIGEEIAVLIDKKLRAGTHSVVFNASKLSSGIYYYRIQAGGFISVKKMTLLK